MATMWHSSKQSVTCVCSVCVVTHQANELPVQPTQNIRPLLRLSSKNSQTGHEDSGSFLVKRGLNVLNLRLCICPAGGGRGRHEECKSAGEHVGVAAVTHKRGLKAGT